MIAKRIIPCLDIKDGRTVKGINFEGLRDAGDPVELAKRYSDEGADELVFLDITATKEKRKTLIDLVKKIALEIDIPFTVGGGVKKIALEIDIPFTVGGGIGNTEQIAELLHAGADKVSLNSAIVRNPDLINEAAKQFGSQCIVAAVDAKRIKDEWIVFISGGSKNTGKNALKWIKEVEERGAGEILLTSMDQDGTKEGFDIELLQQVNKFTTIPVIASGGAGTKQHCIDAIKKGHADAVLAASIFHFQEIGISDLKKELQRANISVRNTI